MKSHEKSLDIEDALEAEVNQIARQVSTKVLHGMVKKTPKGKPSTWQSPPPPGYVPGDAKGNWFVSLNESKRTVEHGRRRSNALSEGTVMIALAKRVEYPTIVISNSLDYIEALNNGWSKQAPAKFVELELQKVKNG